MSIHAGPSILEVDTVVEHHNVLAYSDFWFISEPCSRLSRDDFKHDFRDGPTSPAEETCDWFGSWFGLDGLGSHRVMEVVANSARVEPSFIQFSVKQTRR